MKRAIFPTLLALLLAACLVVSPACGPGAKFELGTLNISPSEVIEGDSVTASVDVTNSGEAEGNFEAKLKLENAIVQTKDITISAGETKTISFTINASTSGTYNIELNELKGAFTVLAPPQYANLYINPTQAKTGEEVTISADISNTGQTSGNYTVALKINGTDEQTKTMAVNAGETYEASFTLTKTVPGTYNVSLGTLSGVFTVLKPAGFTLSNLVISPTQAVAGWPVSIMCDVTNTGDTEGCCPVNLKVNDVQVESKEVTVAGGVTQTVAFSLVKDIGGTYNVLIGDLSGTLTVAEGVLPALNIGDQWVYRLLDGGVIYTATERVVGEELIDGKSCYVEEITYDPAFNGVSKQTFWREKATLSTLRYQYSFVVSDVTVTCSGVYKIQSSGDNNWPLAVGKQWTENETITETCKALWATDTQTYAHNYSYKVDMVENITVGAGTFRCYKISVYESGQLVYTNWYSDKIKNFVRSDDIEDEGGLQLLSYSVK
jgi:hypothetical protein